MDKIYCVDGLKFTGQIKDISYTLFSSMQWVKLSTGTGDIVINADYIISIVYGVKTTQRTRNKNTGDKPA